MSSKTIQPALPLTPKKQPHQQFQPQSYLANGGPTPGAQALLPNNGRVIQSGATRVLCLADVRGTTKRAANKRMLTVQET